MPSEGNVREADNMNKFWSGGFKGDKKLHSLILKNELNLTNLLIFLFISMLRSCFRR